MTTEPVMTVRIFHSGKIWIALAPEVTTQAYTGRSAADCFGKLMGYLAADIGVEVQAFWGDDKRHVLSHSPASYERVMEFLSQAPDGKKRLAAKIESLLFKPLSLQMAQRIPCPDPANIRLRSPNRVNSD